MSSYQNKGNNNYQSKKPKNPPVVVESTLGVDELELIQADSFTVISSVSEVSEEITDKLLPALNRLKQKAYKMNYANDTRDILAAKVFKKFEIYSDIYLPFKGFNKEAMVSSDEDEVLTATLEEPSIKAHKLAAKYRYKNERDEEGNIKYNSLNEFAKKFTARDVHLFLGSKCATKIKFLIILTNDTAEAPSEATYESTGSNVVFPIKLADVLEIPVFNLNKPKRLDDLIEYIDSL